LEGFIIITLDTHDWLWWLSNLEQLSPNSQKAIDQAIAKDTIYLSAISIWEVSLLVKKGRLKLTMDLVSWLEKAEAVPYVTFIPIDNRIALNSVLLPATLHPDPADRSLASNKNYSRNQKRES